MAAPPLSDDDDLYRLPFDKVLSLLQLSTVLYYLHETNPDNGLVRDKTDPKAPVSIAAVGMALATIPVVVERGLIIREFAAKITLKRLQYLLECPQGPEPGLIPHRWQGYDEGLLLYILGLGSPTHPLPPESYRAYCATYQWKTIYDRELLYSGPLFTHQLSHMWVDFRGIRDDFMRARGSDYFENSR